MEIRRIRVNRHQEEKVEGLSVEYPYVMHRGNLAETKIPWHWHEEVEFVFVRQGHMRLLTAGRAWEFREGEGFFVNSNVLCSMENLEHCQIDSHLLHSAFLGGHFKSIFETKYLAPVLKNKRVEVLEFRREREGQRRILRLLLKAAALQEKENTEFQTRNLFSEIWLMLLEEIDGAEYMQTPVRPARQERLQTMMTFMQQHYQEKLSLDEIAASACVGRREALRCFQVCIHKTPFAYLTEYRIEMSRKLLSRSELPVTEIALQTGFSGAAYYGKVFKEFCGMTPGEYRKKQLAKNVRL